jgi:hypothetical protein
MARMVALRAQGGSARKWKTVRLAAATRATVLMASCARKIASHTLGIHVSFHPPQHPRWGPPLNRLQDQRRLRRIRQRTSLRRRRRQLPLCVSGRTSKTTATETATEPRSARTAGLVGAVAMRRPCQQITLKMGSTVPGHSGVLGTQKKTCACNASSTHRSWDRFLGSRQGKFYAVQKSFPSPRL